AGHSHRGLGSPGAQEVMASNGLPGFAQEMYRGRSMSVRDAFFVQSPLVTNLGLKADNQTDARDTRAQVLHQRVKGRRADIVIPDQSCVGVEYVEYIDDPAYRYRLRDFDLP